MRRKFIPFWNISTKHSPGQFSFVIVWNILVGQNFRAPAYRQTVIQNYKRSKARCYRLKICMYRANVLHFQGSVVSRVDGRYETSSEEATFWCTKKSWILFCDCWYVFGTRQNMLLFCSDINNFQEEILHFCDRNAVAIRKREMLFRECRQPGQSIMSNSLVRIITHFSKICSTKFLQPIKVYINVSYVMEFLASDIASIYTSL